MLHFDEQRRLFFDDLFRVFELLLENSQVLYFLVLLAQILDQIFFSQNDPSHTQMLISRVQIIGPGGLIFEDHVLLLELQNFALQVLQVRQLRFALDFENLLLDERFDLELRSAALPTLSSIFPTLKSFKKLTLA